MSRKRDKVTIKFTQCHLVVVTSIIVELKSCPKSACSIVLRQNVASKYLRPDALQRRSSGNMSSDSPWLDSINVGIPTTSSE